MKDSQYLGLAVTPSQINESVVRASNALSATEVAALIANTLSQANAYTDLHTKPYETENYFFLASGQLTPNKPTGPAITISVTLDGSYKPIYTATLSIPEAGIIKKDNIYSITTFWESVSTSRDTFLRFLLTVNDNITLFDFESGPLNNQYGDFEYTRDIFNQNNVDIQRPANSLIRFSIYGKVSRDNDEIRLVLENIDKLSGLFRSALS